MLKFTLASGLVAFFFVLPAQAQTCTPGETRCFGAVEQHRERGSGYGETRGRWQSTGRSCGGSVGTTSEPVSSAKCQTGETRCGADGYPERCNLGYWNRSYSGERCDVSREETQVICSRGDQKCGPSGTILSCEDANFRGKYAWRDTQLQCR